ncbi:MAG: endonuclease domain-containing protein [Nanoarchaeota archaeon]
MNQADLEKQFFIGAIFDNWTIIGKPFVKSTKQNNWFVKCQCCCRFKTIRDVLCWNLANGRSKSCGCKGTNDYSVCLHIGKIIGRWEVIDKPFQKKVSATYWYVKCRCTCPLQTIREIICRNLLNEKTLCCGCIRKEQHVGGYKRISPLAVDGIKFCTKCEQEKSVDDFCKDNHNRDGLNDVCRTCYRFEQMYNKYGIGEKEYLEFLSIQNNSCGICESLETGTKVTNNFFVDHNHETDKVRGLLCHPCNSSVGLLKEDPSVMLKMVLYLLKNDPTLIVDKSEIFNLINEIKDKLNENQNSVWEDSYLAFNGI